MHFHFIKQSIIQFLTQQIHLIILKLSLKINRHNPCENEVNESMEHLKNMKQCIGKEKFIYFCSVDELTEWITEICERSIHIFVSHWELKKLLSEIGKEGGGIQRNDIACAATWKWKWSSQKNAVFKDAYTIMDLRMIVVKYSELKFYYKGAVWIFLFHYS